MAARAPASPLHVTPAVAVPSRPHATAGAAAAEAIQMMLSGRGGAKGSSPLSDRRGTGTTGGGKGKGGKPAVVVEDDDDDEEDEEEDDDEEWDDEEEEDGKWVGSE